jgi:uncharacterized membrane protein
LLSDGRHRQRKHELCAFHPPAMPQHPVQEHVDLIAKHEQDFLARRSAAERIGDGVAAFAGTPTFVILHLVLFATWIIVNSAHFRGVTPFDPPPFSLLGTLVALEALLLVSFILMRQTRIGRRAEERDHLMLQILLLTEKEMTAVIGMTQTIAAQVGAAHVAHSAELDRLAQKTSIDDVAQAIEKSLPADS